MLLPAQITIIVHGSAPRFLDAWLHSGDPGVDTVQVLHILFLPAILYQLSLGMLEHRVLSINKYKLKALTRSAINTEDTYSTICESIKNLPCAA
jgi:hypothetical protein